MKKTLQLTIFFLLFSLFSANLYASELIGQVAVKRNAERKIVEAYLKTDKKDASGNPVQFQILFDDNGESIAYYYEHKWLKVEGAIKGKTIKIEEWKEIESPEYSYIKTEALYPAPLISDFNLCLKIFSLESNHSGQLLNHFRLSHPSEGLAKNFRALCL